MPELQNNLICAVCRQQFKTEQERLAHERSVHDIGRPGPSVEHVNISDDGEKKAS